MRETLKEFWGLLVALIGAGGGGTIADVLFEAFDSVHTLVIVVGVGILGTAVHISKEHKSESEKKREEHLECKHELQRANEHTARHEKALEEQGEALKSIDAKLGGLGAKFDTKLDALAEKMDGKLTDINKRIDKVYETRK